MCSLNGHIVVPNYVGCRAYNGYHIMTTQSNLYETHMRFYFYFFLFLDPRRTMYHSNVSVRLSEVDKLVTSILYVNA